MARFAVFVFLALGCSSIQNPPVAARQAPNSRWVDLDHGYFKVRYDLKYRIAKYVKHRVSESKLRLKKAIRRKKFRPDTILASLGVAPVEHRDYLRVGYDRGHLAPAGDFAWGQEASDATFVMSNVAPQRPELNRGAWKKLEEKIRRWGCGEAEIIVITGVLLGHGPPLLPSGVAIPESFYKLVIDDTPPRKAQAFVFAQSDRGDIIDQRRVPVDELLKRVGEDFSSEVPPDERAIFARGYRADPWKEKDCSQAEDAPSLARKRRPRAR